MIEDTSLWMMLGTMAGTAGLLRFLWFDRSGATADDDWQASQLD